MRKVTFIANGKEFRTYAEARAISRYVETKLSDNFDADATHRATKIWGQIPKTKDFYGSVWKTYYGV